MDNQEDLVRQILTSERFLNASKDEQQQVIEQIQANGVPLETIEEIQNENQLSQEEIIDTVSFFENVPYDVFVSLVRNGKIKGKDVIRLCNSSAKLNDYCNRGVTLPNGQSINKYLFRQLLEDEGVKMDAGDDPRELYIHVHSNYSGFSTAALLELAAQILQNQTYFETQSRIRLKNLTPRLQEQFPGLQLPDKISTHTMKDLYKAKWIHSPRSETQFAPANQEALQIENYRAQIYDFVVRNIGWLTDLNKWPIDRFAGNNGKIPTPVTGHSTIFYGTGYYHNLRRIENLGFQAWTQALLYILGITNRNRHFYQSRLVGPVILNQELASLNNQ